MHKIRDWLYVSGHAFARSETLLHEQQIGALLSLYEQLDHPSVDCLFIPAEEGYPFSTHMIEQGVSFVRQQHEQGKHILISCGHGISRSVSFALASLKEIEGLTLEQAYRQVHSKHAEAMPDHVHWESLCRYYQEESDFWRIWESIVLGE
jgi:protein-tyrosine phosphatase